MATTNTTTTNDAPKSKKLATPPSVEPSEAERASIEHDQNVMARVLRAFGELLPFVANVEGQVSLPSDPSKLSFDDMKTVCDRTKSLAARLQKKHDERERAAYAAQATTIAINAVRPLANAASAQREALASAFAGLDKLPDSEQKENARKALESTIAKTTAIPVLAFGECFPKGTPIETMQAKLSALPHFAAPKGASPQSVTDRKMIVHFSIVQTDGAK